MFDYLTINYYILFFLENPMLKNHMSLFYFHFTKLLTKFGKMEENNEQPKDNNINNYRE